MKDNKSGFNISSYLKSGYSCIFIETAEIKRCVKSIIVDEPFQKIHWDFVSGLDLGSDTTEMDHLELLEKAKELNQTTIVCENFDFFIDNKMLIQTFLNNYETYKFNQVCFVIVGSDIQTIPVLLKELIPIIPFDLPTKDEIRVIAENLSEEALESIKNSTKENEEEYDFKVTEEVIESCLGMSYEEIENVLALSLIEHKGFNIKTILNRKRQIIRSTGFMDFMNPEPIENLGGLENLKKYVFKRKEAFKEGSIKPKLRSILLVGIQGCGKSLSTKVIASIFDWPLVSLDIGALKGGIVGETEKNVRRATKTIDAFGKAIIQLEEIEKSLAGASGQNLDSGVSAGLFGYLLTWFQERTSEGILIATSNDLSKLPPEFLRAGRWDAIFFTDFPNEKEVKEIIAIMNRRYKSDLPISDEFCNELKEEEWTGAEIEQLAKDSHFDSIEKAKENIPLISDFRKDDIIEIKKKAKQFRIANGDAETRIVRKKLSLNKKEGGKKKLNV